MIIYNYKIWFTIHLIINFNVIIIVNQNLYQRPGETGDSIPSSLTYFPEEIRIELFFSNGLPTLLIVWYDNRTTFSLGGVSAAP